MIAATDRALIVARDGRSIGRILNCYVTGDPGPDDLAEYVAQGWLQANDIYGQDTSDTEAAAELVQALRFVAQAFTRLAADLETDGRGIVADLRRIR